MRASAQRNEPSHVVVMGASAGGVESLCSVLEAVPAKLSGTIIVAMHLSPIRQSALPAILSIAGRLPVRFASDGEKLLKGHVYVAPPGHDVLVGGEDIRLRACDAGQRFRPSIDTLFQSTAYHFAERSVGVVLSGALYDGGVGIRSIHRAGGTALVQAPLDAMCDDMPHAALGAVPSARVLPAHRIGEYLGVLLKAHDLQESSFYADPEAETQAEPGKAGFIDRVLQDPFFEGYTCSECHAALHDLRHAAIDATLNHERQRLSKLEAAVMLTQHLAKHLGSAGHGQLVPRLLRESRAIEKEAGNLRQHLSY